MKKWVVLAVVCLLSLPLMAQDKLEVFGGYQYLHNGTVNANGVSQPNSSQNYNGWDVSARFNFLSFLEPRAIFPAPTPVPTVT